MLKILVTDKLAQEGLDLLASMDDVEVAVKTGISEDELASIIGEYDGLIIRSGTQVTAKVLEKSGRLRGVARAGVGVDNVDVAAATKKGIVVMNTPRGNTISLCDEHATPRPKDPADGQEFCSVSAGLHRGVCAVCAERYVDGEWVNVGLIGQDD